MPPEDLKQKPEVMDKQTIAILPFRNMSSDPENEYFADGITEELIIALSTVDATQGHLENLCHAVQD